MQLLCLAEGDGYIRTINDSGDDTVCDGPSGKPTSRMDLQRQALTLNLD